METNDSLCKRNSKYKHYISLKYMMYISYFKSSYNYQDTEFSTSCLNLS